MPKPQKMDKRTFVGVDPGKSGGLAEIYIEGRGRLVEAVFMPITERDILNWLLNTRGKTVAIIERVHAMPKQGVTSMFTFGQNYGTLRMALIAASIPFKEVTPRTWQKHLGITPKKKTETPTQWKNRLKALAQQLFPQEKVTLATADALLIAQYCEETWK